MRFTDSLCKMCRQCAAFLAFFFFFFLILFDIHERRKKWNALSVSASVGNVSCDEIFLFTGHVDWWSLFIYFNIPILSWDWLMIIFLSWSVIEWWPPPHLPPSSDWWSLFILSSDWLVTFSPRAVIEDHFYPEQWLTDDHFFTLSNDWGSLLSWAVIEDHFLSWAVIEDHIFLKSWAVTHPSFLFVV